MRTFLYSLAIILAGVTVSGIVLAQDQQGGSISYPIRELGNCTDRESCKGFCDEPQNTSKCLAFAEKNKLMSDTELQKARQLIQSGTGPGGCTGKESCESYCDDIAHIDECVKYAEENDLMPPKELEEAKKINTAIKSGVKPPACKNKRECDAYCSKPDNMEVCINFAEQAGFLSGDELQEAKKVLTAIKNGATPPPCSGKEACDAYCTRDENINACMDFAQAAGMISSEELEMMKKTGGKGPGGCRGKKECDQVCNEKPEVCADFALQYGLIKPEEAEMMKKTGGKGPGGCRGKESCESFCQDPANQETCFNFGKDNGLIPPEEIQKLDESKKKIKESVMGMPEQVRTCLETSLGRETLSKMESGNFLPSRDVGEKMQKCFEIMGPPQDRRPEGPRPPEGNQMSPGDPQQQMPPEGQYGPRPDGPGLPPPPPSASGYPPPRPDNPYPYPTPPGGQMPPEGQYPPPDDRSGYPPPPEFNPPPEGQLQPSSNMQPEPMAPILEPVAPLPAPESAPAPEQPAPAPSSLLNSPYMGAVLRFLLGN